MFGDLIRQRMPYWQSSAADLGRGVIEFTRIGEPVWDEATGTYTDALTTVYDGWCKIQTFQAFEAEPEAGGAQRVIQRYYVHVDPDAGPFLPGDVGTVKQHERPLLVGNVYVIAGSHEKDWQTTQRLLADLDAGPS